MCIIEGIKLDRKDSIRYKKIFPVNSSLTNSVISLGSQKNSIKSNVS